MSTATSTSTSTTASARWCRATRTRRSERPSSAVSPSALTSGRPPRRCWRSSEELARRFGLPSWRFTNSGTESTMDAIRIARAYTGRDDIAEGLRRLPRPPRPGDGERGRSEAHDGRAAALGRGDPAVHRRADPPRGVQRRGGSRAPHRRARRRRPSTRLRDSRARDDEGQGRPAGARLPGGRPRDHSRARGAPDLRRGQDRPDDRGGRCHRALRREAGHGGARQGARRRPALGRNRDDRRSGGLRRDRARPPGRHLQRQPALDGGGPREPRGGAHVRPPTSVSRRSASVCAPAARR